MNSAESSNHLAKRPKETDLTSRPTDPDLLREQKDGLLGMYCENRAHARHCEDKRATVSNIIMVVTIGLVGYIRHLDYEDWPLTAAIALVGVFGAAFTKYYFDCISSYERRADELRNGLNALLFESSVDSPNTLIDILARADGVNPHELKNPHKPKMAWFRQLWPLGISCVALIATIYALNLTPNPQTTKVTIDAGGNSQSDKR